MIKMRLQGTVEDIARLEEQLACYNEIQIVESSDVYRNKGTNKHFRKYLEIEVVEEK